MITIGRYTFASEEDRKADYRRRVGPLRRPRTNTVERPEPEQPLTEWLAYIKEAHLTPIAK